jgi:hypothetical protein
MAKAAKKSARRSSKPARKPAPAAKKVQRRRASPAASRPARPAQLLKALRTAYEASAEAVAGDLAKALTDLGVRGEAAWAAAERLAEGYRGGSGGRGAWIFSGLTSLALSKAVDDALDPGPGDEPRPTDLPGQAFFVARHDVLSRLMDLHDMEVD